MVNILADNCQQVRTKCSTSLTCMTSKPSHMWLVRISQTPNRNSVSQRHTERPHAERHWRDTQGQVLWGQKSFQAPGVIHHSDSRGFVIVGLKNVIESVLTSFKWRHSCKAVSVVQRSLCQHSARAQTQPHIHPEHTAHKLLPPPHTDCHCFKMLRTAPLTWCSQCPSVQMELSTGIIAPLWLQNVSVSRTA